SYCYVSFAVSALFCVLCFSPTLRSSDLWYFIWYSCPNYTDCIQEKSRICGRLNDCWLWFIHCLSGTTKTVDKPKPAIVKPTTNRSEEHTSELQSRENLVCRLLPEKKNQN